MLCDEGLNTKHIQITSTLFKWLIFDELPHPLFPCVLKAFSCLVLPSDACELTLDQNTANVKLSLSDDNTKVTVVEEKQSYPDHPERFDFFKQVLCREGLTGRCYWEIEREGDIATGVTYRGIPRLGYGGDSAFGWNSKSWRIDCRKDGYTAWYNGIRTEICLPPPGSNRLGVYLDWSAGTLSFYRVSPGIEGSSDTLTHIYTFHATFTQELHPGFRLWSSGARFTKIS